MKVLIIIWLVSLFPSSLLGKLTNQQVDLAEYAYREAIKNSINPEQFARLVYCESRFSISALGDYQIETDTYLSRGILQFQKRTFYWLQTISNKKNLQWKNKNHQIELFNWAIQNNQGDLWSCYKYLKLKGEI